MALEDLTPAVRVEAILDGADIEPANRLEYFLQKAANEVPKPAAADAGKMLVAGETGYELTDQKDIATVKNFLIIATNIGHPETADSQALTIQVAPDISDIFAYLQAVSTGGPHIVGAIQLTLACGNMHPLTITDWTPSGSALTAQNIRYVGEETVDGTHYYHFISYTVQYLSGTWSGLFRNILFEADDYNTIVNPV